MICEVTGCSAPHSAKGLCTIHYQRKRRTGQTGPVHLVEMKYTGECLMDGCYSPDRSLGLCEVHYRRFRRTGDPAGVGKGRPREASPTYVSVHSRLSFDRGPARLYRCVGCGERAAHWAYDHKDPNELVDGSPFSVDQSHYVPMCPRCHNAFDRGDEARLPDQPLLRRFEAGPPHD